MFQDCVFDACAQNDTDLAVEQTEDAIYDFCYINGFNCTLTNIFPG